MEQGRIYSMLDIAIQVLKDSNEPLHLTDIFQKVSDIKGFDINSVSKINQLYQDMTQSAVFVYVGEGCLNLKERNLEAWDKDGTDFEKESSFDVDFLSDEETEDDILEYENYTVDTEQLAELEDYDDDDDIEEDEEKISKGVIHSHFDEEDEDLEDNYIEKSDKHSKDEDGEDFDYDDYLDYEDEEDDYDEEINKYNDIMDDYESEY